MPTKFPPNPAARMYPPEGFYLRCVPRDFDWPLQQRWPSLHPLWHWFSRDTWDDRSVYDKWHGFFAGHLFWVPSGPAYQVWYYDGTNETEPDCPMTPPGTIDECVEHFIKLFEPSERPAQEEAREELGRKQFATPPASGPAPEVDTSFSGEVFLGYRVLRVSLDFDWPLLEPWPGNVISRTMAHYLSPKWRDVFAQGAIHPPQGPGYQVWETVYGRAPASPVFSERQDCVQWIRHNGGLAGPKLLALHVGARE